MRYEDLGRLRLIVEFFYYIKQQQLVITHSILTQLYKQPTTINKNHQGFICNYTSLEQLFAHADSAIWSL
jgi:hypothetical protein